MCIQDWNAYMHIYVYHMPTRICMVQYQLLILCAQGHLESIPKSSYMMRMLNMSNVHLTLRSCYEITENSEENKNYKVIGK